MVTNRFDVFLISLDPTRGSEIRKTRPCLIISPDEMNQRKRPVDRGSENGNRRTCGG